MLQIQKGRGKRQGVSVKTASAMPSRTELGTKNTGLESIPASLRQAPATTGRHNHELASWRLVLCVQVHFSPIYMFLLYTHRRSVSGQVQWHHCLSSEPPNMSKQQRTCRARRKAKGGTPAVRIGPKKLEIASSLVSNFLMPLNTTYYSVHQNTNLGHG